jgi:hypothetical protein
MCKSDHSHGNCFLERLGSERRLKATRLLANSSSSHCFVATFGAVSEERLSKRRAIQPPDRVSTGLHSSDLRLVPDL